MAIESADLNMPENDIKLGGKNLDFIKEELKLQRINRLIRHTSNHVRRITLHNKATIKISFKASKSFQNCQHLRFNRITNACMLKEYSPLLF